MDLEAGTPKVTLKDFGYTEIEKKGKLKFEFENQEFLPKRSGTRWWVVYNPDVVKRYDEVLGDQKQFRWRPPYVFAHFRGYLSPDIGIDVGHFNEYDRKFVVTGIIEMKRFEDTTQPTVAADAYRAAELNVCQQRRQPPCSSVALC